MSRWAEGACLLATLWIVARLVSYYVLNSFYAAGASTDALMASGASWQSGWLLYMTHHPDVMDSFLRMHIAASFWVPNAISYILPEIGRIPLFAWFIGGLHAVLALAMWLLLQALWPSRHWIIILLRCAAAGAFALNANSQITLLMQHTEIAGPAFALIFLWALFRRARGITPAAFVLTMVQREDMGFHIFGVLFLLLVLDQIRGVPPERSRPALFYALAAFAYSIAALLLQHFVFKNNVGGSMFMREYIGNVPFEHITERMISERLTNLIYLRPWIWAPGLIALVWALAARNPYLVVGWLAFVPWLLLSFFAPLELAGNFSLHYGFPFIIAGAWPLLAVGREFMEARQVRPAGRRLLPVWVTVLLLVQQPTNVYPYLSFKMHWIDFLPRPEIYAKDAYDDFERRLPSALPRLGSLRADFGVFNIAPYTLYMLRHGIDIWPETAAYGQGTYPEDKVDSVFYFPMGFNYRNITEFVRNNNLYNHYKIPGTNLYLSTWKNLEDIPEFTDLFVPTTPPREVRGYVKPKPLSTF